MGSYGLMSPPLLVSVQSDGPIDVDYSFLSHILVWSSVRDDNLIRKPEIRWMDEDFDLFFMIFASDLVLSHVLVLFILL